MVNKVGSGSHGGDKGLDESKAENKSGGDKSKDAADKSNNGSNAATGASGGATVAEKVGGAATFEALIAELKAVNQQAMMQDIRLRSLSTELSSERKAASERVNG
ncbi:hypothetical protein [Bradyrhizobium iriomotense]|uniref:Nodulation protein NopA n=1 Tax=Bradyrhizobium iriomotense TaxID=441950 RepID=A0ABQ6B7D9_9BRAD|nr:hypothetical protein [Bradyrhizobium iriomotense]GLR89688.1 hypothetical protein GCM10007857_64020 [Bradyrhizobium iriomotense]